MQTITRIYNVYTFDELTEKAQQNALNKLREINLDPQWWDAIYEDAQNIGLKITGFDLDRCKRAKGKFIYNADDVANRIIKEHGENTETYKLAKAYLNKCENLLKECEKDKQGTPVHEYEHEQDIDNENQIFLIDLLTEYANILQKDYEYLQSDEAIKQAIEGYLFFEDGTEFI